MWGHCKNKISPLWALLPMWNAGHVWAPNCGAQVVPHLGAYYGHTVGPQWVPLGLWPHTCPAFHASDGAHSGLPAQGPAKIGTCGKKNEGQPTVSLLLGPHSPSRSIGACCGLILFLQWPHMGPKGPCLLGSMYCSIFPYRYGMHPRVSFQKAEYITWLLSCLCALCK